MGSLRGQLLVAGPTLLDPSFERTVVLVGEHTLEGALGVVLNRLGGADVGTSVPGLSVITGPDAWVHSGGPVQPEAVLVLAEHVDPAPGTELLTGRVGFLTLDDDSPGLLAVSRARVFSGYAGWGPGQLESELARDDWIVVPARPDDVFDEHPQSLWHRVLQRQGGRLKMLSLVPKDPTLN